MSDKLKLLILFALRFENDVNLIEGYCKLLESKIASMQLNNEQRSILNPNAIVKKCTK